MPQPTDPPAEPTKPKPDATPPDTDEPTDEPDWRAEAAKWKALARKHEGQAKDNVGAARKLAELEDADKTEIEKANARATAAEQKAATAEHRALRAEIAAEKGLSLAVAKRLVGDTREELETDADELLEAFGPKPGAKNGEDAKKPDARRTPREQLRPGASNPEDESDEIDPKKAGEIADRIAATGRI